MVQIISWPGWGGKPFSEPLLTNISIASLYGFTKPQWLNVRRGKCVYDRALRDIIICRRSQLFHTENVLVLCMVNELPETKGWIWKHLLPKTWSYDLFKDQFCDPAIICIAKCLNINIDFEPLNQFIGSRRCGNNFGSMIIIPVLQNTSGALTAKLMSSLCHRSSLVTNHYWLR